MAKSRMRFAIFGKDDSFQVRVTNFSGRDLKRLQQKLNIYPASDALERMDSYADLRDDEYFILKGKSSNELCFTATSGRLLLIRNLMSELQFQVETGAELLPSEELAEEKLARQSEFSEELSHIVEQNLPFYKKGAGPLFKGMAIRVGILVVLLFASRMIYLQRSDHFQPRSLHGVIKTLETTPQEQSFYEYFVNPVYSHRSNLKISRFLYSRGNRAILEGGFYVQIDGIQNLKASMEAHNNAPLLLKVDTREGSMKLTGIYMGDDLVTHKGELKIIGRMPILGKEPSRVAALDPNSRGAYVKVSSADPLEEGTFNWMLGQAVSVTARLSDEGDRYLIGEEEFKFAIPKNMVKPEVQEILDLAAANNERAIVDMRLSAQPYPLRNRRNPREQRRDTGIITEGNLHYVQVQSAILKNISSMAATPTGKLAILLVGGGRDRLAAAINMAVGAQALGRTVTLFFSWEALLHLSHGALQSAPLPATLAPFATTIAAAQETMPPLDELLQSLRQDGLQVYACSNTLPTLGISPEDLEGKVDGISGVTAFLAMSEDAQILCF